MKRKVLIELNEFNKLAIDYAKSQPKEEKKGISRTTMHKVYVQKAKKAAEDERTK